MNILPESIDIEKIVWLIAIAGLFIVGASAIEIVLTYQTIWISNIPIYYFGAGIIIPLPVFLIVKHFRS